MQDAWLNISPNETMIHLVTFQQKNIKIYTLFSLYLALSGVAN